MRVHDRVVEAMRRGDDLVCPLPGQFRPAVVAGDVVRAGTTLGQLDVLGRVSRVTAPQGARGVIARVAEGAIDYGAVLVGLDPTAALLGQAAAAAPATADDPAGKPAGHVFRAPTSGRLYLRPGPDKPPFVAAGAQLHAGATICLLEVMKTFNRVTYAGEPARVAAVLASDGADVAAGDPLLALDSAVAVPEA